VVVLDLLDAADALTLFVLAGAALIPLSWTIGEATDNLARHTGPGIGGFLNATFGNAPELIIAIVAVTDGLTTGLPRRSGPPVASRAIASSCRTPSDRPSDRDPATHSVASAGSLRRLGSKMPAGP
jgi:hypothetical protein